MCDEPESERTEARIRDGRNARRAGVVVLGCFVLAWWIGWRGIDFGHHWDEPRLLNSAAEAYRRREFLPHWYNYPSLSFDLTFISLLPELAHTAPQAAPANNEGSIDVGREALLRVRLVFMTLSLLSGVVAFAAARAAGAGHCASVFAAAVVLSSWEIGYHARWIAPDGLVTTFCLLSTTLLLVALRRPDQLRRWTWMAAAAAGLATSAKYPAGATLLPVLVVAIVGARRGPHGVFRWRRLAGACVGPLALFAIVFVATTPGILLEPTKFLHDVQFERHHYAVKGHRGNDTFGLLDHSELIARYLAVDGASPYDGLGLAITGLALIGTLRALRRPWLHAFVLLFLPTFILLYMATQKVMIVRNLLLAIPFSAVLAGLGLEGAAVRICRRRPRLATPAAAAVGVLLVAPGQHFGVAAAQSIAARRERNEVRELREFIAAHPEHPLVLSKRLSAELGEPFGELLPNDDETWIAFYTSEVSDRSAWLVNRVDYRLLPSAPLEVNFRYYPTWRGDRRIVLAPLSQVLGSKLPRALGFSRPRPTAD